MRTSIDEATVEHAALEWFEAMGYTIGHRLTPDAEDPAAERRTYGALVLVGRLRSAIERLNPHLPEEARADALGRAQRGDSAGLVAQNRQAHRMLVDGVPVEYARPDGTIAGDRAALADFARPERNDWLVANQVTVREGGTERRLDIAVFLNGLPIAVFELKNPLDDDATLQGAYNQLRTYRGEFPALFVQNEILVVSDGKEARAGTLTAEWSRFMPWKTIEGDGLPPRGMWELEVLIKGIFERRRLLDLLAHFVVFEDDGAGLSKKLAAYHQYHAVNRAVEATVGATAAHGDRKAGVIWHTQGSGKSLTMAFYAGKLVREPAMRNPTLVVLTDRNDLDDQLFGAFAACADLLRQAPVQAHDREHLRELLRVASGGIVFTTIQKFLPPEGDRQPALSQRENIVFIADEAHRSQYGFRPHVVRNTGAEGAEEARIAYGLAQHLRDALPRASYIGFTGTPIEHADRSTRQVFGDYIDTYDIQQAVEDGATVPIYYEARMAKLGLDERERPRIDPEFEELTEGEEIEGKHRLMSRWAQLEKLVGAPRRLELVAADLVRHAEGRLEALDGKVLVVCMSRAICARLYEAIVRLRPDWHDDGLEAGAIKVVMTGAATDPPELQPHIRSKAASRALARRFKDPADGLKLVIVRDMWLTGFDVPSLHTMYLDKPMQGHGLMQAIARVNRVFKDKPGGLVVDYLGLAEQLRRALADYTARDREDTAIPQGQAVALLLERCEIVRDLFHGFDYSGFFGGTAAGRMGLLANADDFILGAEDRKKRLPGAVTSLLRAYALAVPDARALALQDEIAFFQAVSQSLQKATSTQVEQKASLESAINRLVSRVVVSDEVVDIFAAAGLRKPEISILSDAFLEDVQGLPQRNLALEVLKKLLNDEIRTRGRRNVVQARSFAEQLEKAIRRYQSRSIEAAQVIQELVDLAKAMRAAAGRGERLGLSDDELAFYDALGTNDSAVQGLGDETLKRIARELVATVRGNVTIDWQVKESVRAKLRVTIKRLLRTYGYPPDRQEEAVRTIIEQSEELSKDWAV